MNRSGVLPNFVGPVVILVFAMTLLLLSVPEPAQQAITPVPPQLFSSSFHLLGTGNRLGTYYPAGHVLVDWMNSHFDENSRVFKAIETNGSIENIRLLNEKRLILGMVESRIVKESFARKPGSNLRLVWPLWSDVVHIIVAPGVQAGNLDFFANQTGFIGQQGSSTNRTSTEIFGQLNLSTKIKSVSMHPDMVFSALTNQKIGFATIQAGIPNRTVSDAVIFHGCQLANIPESMIDNMISNVSMSREFIIPEGFYGERQPQIRTLGISNVLVANADTDDEMIGLVVDLLVKGASHLRFRHRAISEIPVDAEIARDMMQSLEVPIHNGTLNWLNNRAVHGQ